MADPLLQSFQLKHLHLKNRIITTSHEPAYNEDGFPKDRYIAYHLERAKGGIAMTMTAGSAVVSKDSPPSFDNIHAYKDEVVPWIKKLTDTIHDHDCKIMIQLTHLGRRTSWSKGDWLPSLSSGKHREPAHKAFPKVMESWDIERIIKEYGDAAARMKEGGMDGVELEGQGHLIGQFLSPLTNELSTEYGGSLENRLRFTIDVLSDIRKKVGQDFIVGIRCVFDEVEEGGITKSQGLKIAKILSDSGLVDYLNVNKGRIHTDPILTKHIPIQGMKSAPHLEFAGEIKKEIQLPIFHASKISDVATARYAISNGLVDMIGMTRGHLADPHIVTKIKEKREEDIRPCVGATYCLDRIYQGEEALCIHNAATGRELKFPNIISPSTVKKKIVVVGAGPAGLEAARIAGERGHEVIVFEAARDPGGQIRLCAKSERRRDMLGIIDWRMQQCAKNVKFNFNVVAESQDVIGEKPHTVIIATGGMPNLELFETKKDLENVYTSWDIISGDIKLSDNILIYDEAGDHTGMQSAEIAIKEGSTVEFMTPDRLISSEIMGMNLTPYLKNLQDKKITYSIAKRLLDVSIKGNKLNALIGSDYDENFKYNSSYDQVFLNYGIKPLDELYFSLVPFSKNKGEVDYNKFINGDEQDIIKIDNNKFNLFRIGDAVSSRNIHAAIYDALRLVINL
ncbi:MAG: NADH:flavin oxidoreductase [Proteobacteria bacterium]|nr:NADH:flavin oxidoreductase [Pseudomonadota bacterium]MDA1180791.1 NADH:flavin oxidoreductase [Pseudomonadota bacterium]